MRITGGMWGGRQLAGPGKGHEVRPSGSRVREALFSMLAAMVADARVLDLFAGVGTLGLEALSRGAGHVTFVEKSRRHAVLVRDNIARLDCQDRTRLLVRDVFPALGQLQREGQRFELILADPPYGWSCLHLFLGQLAESGLLVPGGQLVLEHSFRDSPSMPGWELKKFRRYGDTGLSIWGLPTHNAYA